MSGCSECGGEDEYNCVTVDVVDEKAKDDKVDKDEVEEDDVEDVEVSEVVLNIVESGSDVLRCCRWLLSIVLLLLILGVVDVNRLGRVDSADVVVDVDEIIVVGVIEVEVVGGMVAVVEDWSGCVSGVAK